ncbi:hypothetical protein NEOLI_003580, partial [Neolecta irregularis DAH-3]
AWCQQSVWNNDIDSQQYLQHLSRQHISRQHQQHLSQQHQHWRERHCQPPPPPMHPPPLHPAHAHPDCLSGKDRVALTAALIAHRTSSVSRKNKVKLRSHKQRARQNAAMEKRLATDDILRKKVTDSTRRNKVVKDRAKSWDDINSAFISEP